MPLIITVVEFAIKRVKAIIQMKGRYRIMRSRRRSKRRLAHKYLMLVAIFNLLCPYNKVTAAQARAVIHDRKIVIRWHIREITDKIYGRICGLIVGVVALWAAVCYFDILARNVNPHPQYEWWNIIAQAIGR